MNSYEAKLDQRKARLQARARALNEQSKQVIGAARKMAAVIPFGQPILVGHHSESRDRRYRNRIHDTFGKGFALSEAADKAAQRAGSVGTGGISSDDPDALVKLAEKLEAMQRNQALMIASNKAIRSHSTIEGKIDALIKLGHIEAVACELVKPDFCNRIGFADYQLQNNNGNMRRVKLRIAELQRSAQRLDVQIDAIGYTYKEDAEENRAMFFFPGKPTAAIRDLLKAHSFKWSPTRGAWIRQLNAQVQWIAGSLRPQIDALIAA